LLLLLLPLFELLLFPSVHPLLHQPLSFVRQPGAVLKVGRRCGGEGVVERGPALVVWEGKATVAFDQQLNGVAMAICAGLYLY
jgi:hypothetical protein